MKWLALLIFALSFSAIASDPQAKMERLGANIAITFNDYANSSHFEEYQCRVHIDDWLDSVRAYQVQVDGKTMYQCLYQGYLNDGKPYLVWISHKDWPEGWVSSSSAFWLEVE